MNILKKFFVWFVYSSSNPQNIALTLKAGVPFLVLLNLGDAETLNSAVNSFIDVLVNTGVLVTSVITTYGAARKVFLSLPFIKKY
jgi:hypothetical protein